MSRSIADDGVLPLLPARSLQRPGGRARATRERPHPGPAVLASLLVTSILTTSGCAHRDQTTQTAPPAPREPDTSPTATERRPAWRIDVANEPEPAGTWVAVLRNPDASVARKVAACEAIAAAGPNARAAGPSLVEALNDPRLWPDAFAALQSIGPAAAAPLAEALGAGDARARRLAAEVLDALGHAAAPAEPALAAATGDPDPAVAAFAHNALDRMAAAAKGRVPPPPLPALPAPARPPEEKLAKEDEAPERPPTIVADKQGYRILTDEEAAERVAVLNEEAQTANRGRVWELTTELARLAGRHEVAAEALRGLLRHESVETRAVAAVKMVDHRLGGKELEPVLAEALEKWSWGNDEGRVLGALATVAPANKQLSALTRRLAHRDESVRLDAVYILRRMGRHAEFAVPDLMDALTDPSKRVRITAVGAVERARGFKSLATGFADDVARGYEPVASDAASILLAMGPAAKEAVPRLIVAVQDADAPAGARARSIETLARIAGDDPPARAAVLSVLQPPAAERAVAVRIGGGDDSRRYTFDDASVLAAVRGLDALKLEPEVAAAALVHAMKHQADPVRRAAVAHLGKLGPAAVPAVRRALADDKNPAVRQAAVQALAALAGPSPDAAGALVAALDDPDATIRTVAIHEISALGDAARPGVARITKSLTSESEPERAAAVEALARLGPVAADAEGALVRTATAPEDPLHAEAALALARVAPASPGTADALLPLLRAGSREQRFRTLDALAQVAAPPEKRVPALSALLDEPDNDLRLRAVAALEGIGPAARPAAAQLARMVDNRYLAVRRAAARALVKVEPTGAQLAAAYMAAVRNRDAEAVTILAPAVRGTPGEATKRLESRLAELARSDPEQSVRSDARAALRAMEADSAGR